MNDKKYIITFTFSRDLEKSIRVLKKTKKINKIFYIPRSLISSEERYVQHKQFDKDAPYTVNRIALELPEWYVKKELGFYR